jgi:hypothetical protein
MLFQQVGCLEKTFRRINLKYCTTSFNVLDYYSYSLI